MLHLVYCIQYETMFRVSVFFSFMLGHVIYWHKSSILCMGLRLTEQSDFEITEISPVTFVCIM